MAYFYIKSTGTAGATTDAGRFTSLQTGAFTDATSYASLADARNAGKPNPPAPGDFYLISDGTTLTVADIVPAAGDDGVSIVSVADLNRDQYSQGATLSSTVDLDPAAENISLKWHGIKFDVGDDADMAKNGYHGFYEDCIFDFPNTTNDAPTFAAGSHGLSHFKGGEFNLTAASGSGIALGGSTHVLFDGVTNNTGAARAALVTGLGSTRNHLEMRNMDLGEFISINGDLIEDNLPATGSLKVDLHRCKLPSGFGLFAGTTADAIWFEVNMTACDQTDGYHYFFHQNPLGETEEDLVQYLNDTYDGVNEFSAKVSTTALASKGQPYKFKLASIPNVDLATANKTLSVELSGPAGLTDSEVWIEAVVNDDTDEAQGQSFDSRPTDILSAGTALTSSSEVWAVTTNTEYSIDIDFGAFTNADNNTIEVYLYVAEPSAVINFAMPTIANT